MGAHDENERSLTQLARQIGWSEADDVANAFVTDIF